MSSSSFRRSSTPSSPMHASLQCLRRLRHLRRDRRANDRPSTWIFDRCRWARRISSRPSETKTPRPWMTTRETTNHTTPRRSRRARCGRRPPAPDDPCSRASCASSSSLSSGVNSLRRSDRGQHGQHRYHPARRTSGCSSGCPGPRMRPYHQSRRGEHGHRRRPARRTSRCSSSCCCSGLLRASRQSHRRPPRCCWIFGCSSCNSRMSS